MTNNNLEKYNFFKKTDLPQIGLDRDISAEALEKKGYYLPERRIEIKSIPTVIADPHAEVLPLWMEIQNGPALLIHIDNHADMGSGAPTLEQAKKEYAYANIQNYTDYARTCLSVIRFICVAIHEKKVGSVYWYDPRENYVKSYGRVQNGSFLNQPITTVNKEGRIEWNSASNEPPSESIQIQEVQRDIASFNGPIIIDIDLDSFLCTKDPVGQNPDVMFERLGKFREFIKSLGRKPTIISIARSQTPTLWTPPEKVDKIQNEVLKILNEVF